MVFLCHFSQINPLIGGGNSNIFYVHPEIWKRWTHFDEHIFQMGWFNHQPGKHPFIKGGSMIPNLYIQVLGVLTPLTNGCVFLKTCFPWIPWIVSHVFHSGLEWHCLAAEAQWSISNVPLVCNAFSNVFFGSDLPYIQHISSMFSRVLLIFLVVLFLVFFLLVLLFWVSFPTI